VRNRGEPPVHAGGRALTKYAGRGREDRRGGFRCGSRVERLIERDGELWLDETFIDAVTAQEMMAELLSRIEWQTETLTVFGKTVVVPRRVAYYGDTDAVYRYSGVTHRPRPWFALLAGLRDRVAAVAQAEFNSVLANLYRSGEDSMGWHADDEPELGCNPVIASVSLGETRCFQIRHQASGERLSLPLPAGSLVVMRGAFQAHWRHAVPKSRRRLGPRINLSFRRVIRDHEQPAKR